MTLTLLIARHGNTFDPGQIPTRVGGRTDLPLVARGREQAHAIGIYLKQNNLIPDVVYAGPLKRTMETAQIAVKETGVSNPVYPLEIFREIDYGPDENQSEEIVIARIGEQALKDWDRHATVPPGWEIDPTEIIKNWKDFVAHHVKTDPDGAVILVVTSNGIARFAPYITDDFESLAATHPIKIAPGAICRLDYNGKAWSVTEWGVRP